MGKRSRRREPVRAAELKRDRLGLVDGFSKRHLDAMNTEAKRLYGHGVGVLTMEAERNRMLLSADTSVWARVRRWRRRRAIRREFDLWDGRLRTVADAVAGAELAGTPHAR